MITITPYYDKYAESMSRIIIQNLMEINSKDYGIEFCKNSAKDFTPEKIKEDFKKRTKVFVALENDIVVGTAGLDKSWYNDEGEYYILSVFVDVSHHKQGIGRILMQKVEEFAKEKNVKRLVIPASIAGAEFYHKWIH